MKLRYDANYWSDYYHGPYRDTFRLGFDLDHVLACWRAVCPDLPTSFADIGCGTGETLRVASATLPGATVWGVEVQPLPKAQCVSDKIVFGDFMTLHPTLQPVDLLYVSCSMYVPWRDQPEFLRACRRLARRAVWFANLYLEDGLGIPQDPLRITIYRDRAGFRRAFEATGEFRRTGQQDFFVRR